MVPAKSAVERRWSSTWCSWSITLSFQDSYVAALFSSCGHQLSARRHVSYKRRISITLAYQTTGSVQNFMGNTFRLLPRPYSVHVAVQKKMLLIPSRRLAIVYVCLKIDPNTCHSRSCTLAGGKALRYAKLVKQRTWQAATF